MIKLKTFLYNVFPIINDVGRAAGIAATALALTTVFSSAKFVADAWFLDATALIVVALVISYVPLFLVFFPTSGTNQWMTFWPVLVPAAVLMGLTWEFWNLIPEFAAMLVFGVIGYIASRMDAIRPKKAVQQAPVRVAVQLPPEIRPVEKKTPPPKKNPLTPMKKENIDCEDFVPVAEGEVSPYTYLAEQFLVKFENVAGMEPIKERLKEAAREVFGPREEGQDVRNGVLLYGEPGNGKTFFAEALSGEMWRGMIKVSIADVQSKWVGQTTEQVVLACREAIQQAPCILFIDEIDSLIKDRNQTMNASEEAAKTTNALLTEFVNLRRHKVLLIAATNFVDRLDPAAIREGRFDFKIEITPPDATARKALLLRAIGKHKGINAQPEAIEQAVKRWEGFSVARINAVGDAAGRAAAKARRDSIAYPDLQAAMRETQGRAGKLPPDTPLLSELVMPQALSEQIKGVAYRMKHIEETERLGGKIPGGILFWGPPGTGKTITVRSLAKTAGWAFLETTGSVLLGNPDKIDEIVRQARDIRPCIVFLDEGDDVLAHRQMNPHAASITNRLLTAIDGAGGAVHDVVWVAATNHPENIDPAAMRGGRFTVKLQFDVPDKPTLAIFIAKWMKASAAQFEPECQPAALAGILVGLSIANTKAVLQQAADRAVDRKMLLNDRSSVCLNDVREAKKLIVSDF